MTEEQTKLLSRPLDHNNVKKRKGPSGITLDYVEAWHVIDTANQIFGFGNWSRETLEMIELCSGYVENKESFHVSYRARVRITVAGHLSFDGSGVGHGISKYNEGEAHESAIKEAESDAMKRAFICYGYQFGLALYDRDREHVVINQEKTEKPEEKQSFESAFGYLEKHSSLPPLLGSEKQKSWGSKIRSAKLLTPVSQLGGISELKLVKEFTDYHKAVICAVAIDKAKWWIDNRELSTDEILTKAALIYGINYLPEGAQNEFI